MDAMREKCYKALQSLTSGLLIFAILKDRISLLIPCIGEQFSFYYFNPYPRIQIDEFLSKAFRHVIDLKIYERKKRIRSHEEEIMGFITLFSSTYRCVDQTPMYAAESVKLAA